MARKIRPPPRGSPFSYMPGGSALHRLPAGLKLLALLAVSALAFRSAAGLAAAALILLAACAAARVPPRALLRGARPAAALALLVLLARGVGPWHPGIETPEIAALGFRAPPARIPAASAAGLAGGALAALRILVAFAAAGLLFAVTTMREMRLSLAAFEGKIRRALAGRSGQPSPALFSLGLSLTLGFLPRFFQAWEDAGLACRARSLRPGPRRLAVMVPLVAERMMEAAAETALALEARGLGARESILPY